MPSKGNCPLGWDIVFFDSDFDKVIETFEAGNTGLSSLITDVQDSSFKVVGWGDSQKPGDVSIDGPLESLYDKSTRRYVVPLGVRIFNKGSNKSDQAEVFYKIKLVYDPQDPVTCEANKV